MNLLERLRYRKISFSGWQMPLHKWRMISGAKVPEGTKYLGSFSVGYKGRPTDTYVDIYISEKSGYVEAFVHTRADKYWIGQEKVIGGDKK